jgi:hypothetical protein
MHEQPRIGAAGGMPKQAARCAAVKNTIEKD